MRRSVIERMQNAEWRMQKAFLILHSAFCILHFSCASQQPPPITETPAQPAPAEVSTIVVPIRSTLAPLLPLIETQVQKGAESKGYENIPKQPYAVRYRVARDPIALNMEASGLHATTTVHYALEGCRITQKPFSNETTLFPCVSCGFDEPMRDAYVALDAHLEWDENWRLRTRTKARPIEFGRRCTVTFLNLDITDWKRAPVVNEQLQQVAKTIDANVPKLTNIRPIAQQIWSSLQTPSEIAPRTWLVLEPLDAGLAPISGGGLQVTSALALRAAARAAGAARRRRAGGGGGAPGRGRPPPRRRAGGGGAPAPRGRGPPFFWGH